MQQYLTMNMLCKKVWLQSLDFPLQADAKLSGYQDP